MQEDMHYYALYAISRLSNFDVDDAYKIAYSSQYVDDSCHEGFCQNKFGALFSYIPTAHHNIDSVKNYLIKIEEQRKVWIPFHFLPGGIGKNFEEKLICQKQSKIAEEMIKRCFKDALISKYPLYLLGISLHAYMDSFSHFGFSGVSSKYNKVIGDSFEFYDVKNKEILSYINNKFLNFIEKYTNSFWTQKLKSFASQTAEELSGGLGHGAVGTYPDRPYLKWSFIYENNPNKVIYKNNPECYLEAILNVYKILRDFSKKYYNKKIRAKVRSKQFIDKIEEIISFEGKLKERIERWKNFCLSDLFFRCEKNEALKYNSQKWENYKKEIFNFEDTQKIIKNPLYKFHQAAHHYRFYILKILLPKFNIIAF